MAKYSKTTGLSFEKVKISNAIKEVMDFFGIAKSVDGKVAAKVKSVNVMGKASGKRDMLGHRSHSQLWSSIKKFEDARYKASSVILGCNEKIAEKCVKGIDRPFLIISADDMNSKNFTKQLGKTMLEPTCSICIETEGLDMKGTKRLGRFLKSIKDLFDCRLCVILCSSSDNPDKPFPEHCEQNFELDINCSNSDAIETTLESKLEKKRRSMTLENADKLNKETDALKHEVSVKDIQIQNKELVIKGMNGQLEAAKSKCTHFEKENADLQAKLKMAEAEHQQTKQKSSFLETQLNNLKTTTKHDSELVMQVMTLKSDIESLRTKFEVSESKAAEFETENADLWIEMKKIEDEKEKAFKKNLELENNLRAIKYKSSVEKAERIETINELEKMYRNECFQTSALEKEIHILKSGSANNGRIEETVAVSEENKSSLEVIKERLIKNQDKASCAVNQTYRSIKDLKYTTAYKKNDGDMRCDVCIEKGKIIMSYPGLTRFSGVGIDEESSKLDAFKKFVSSVIDYIE